MRMYDPVCSNFGSVGISDVFCLIVYKSHRYDSHYFSSSDIVNINYYLQQQLPLTVTDTE